MSRIFGEARQLGLVVKDIDEGLRAATRSLGVGPFYVLRKVRPDWFRYRGQESTPPLMSLAFAFSGPMQLEIIEQHDDAPSAYREFIDRGQSGAQHLSSWAETPEQYDQMRAAALAAGATIVHEGQLGPGRFAYFDTVETSLGLCFEIAEGLIPPYRPLMDKMAETASNWDGNDPLRDFT